MGEQGAEMGQTVKSSGLVAVPTIERQMAAPGWASLVSERSMQEMENR